MKALKITGLVLTILVSIILITGLFVNGHYAVEREVTINKPKQEIGNYVNQLDDLDNFNVVKDAPAKHKEVKEQTAPVQSITDSDRVNAFAIKKAPGKRVDYEIHFIKPFEATDHSYIISEAVSEKQTKVKWGFKGEMKYPMNLMLLVTDMENKLAPGLEKGLNNLKTTLES